METKSEASLGEERSEAPSIWREEGVFYTQIQLAGRSQPFMIALHGVRSHEEAERAADAFVRRMEEDTDTDGACSPLNS